ncbi:MAG: anaerobic ribonucleoside-triphosphate reductase activating protein [Fibrobacter sp.]|nr:anaerobic ribonucleoside-triphosphate reductase activating protein [Fibrobacter sp.]
MFPKFCGIIACQKNSFIDYPGTVSAVLFFGGCNLRCPFCHNPQIVRNELPAIDFEEIRQFLIKRKKSIDGVVLSGGEPTLNPYLPEIIEELRSSGFLIKLDTNGLNPDIVKKCKPDYLAMDLKTVPQRYPELGCHTGDFEVRLLTTIDIVKQMGAAAEIRIPVSSFFVNRIVVEEIGGILRGVDKVFLQPLKTHTELLDISFSEEPIQRSLLESYCDIIGKNVRVCSIRGI